MCVRLLHLHLFFYFMFISDTLCFFWMYTRTYSSFHSAMVSILDTFSFILFFAKKKWCNRLQLDFLITFDMFADHWHVVISLNDFYTKRIMLHWRANMKPSGFYSISIYSVRFHLFVFFSFDFYFFFSYTLLLFSFSVFTSRSSPSHFLFFYSHHRQCFLLFTFLMFWRFFVCFGNEIPHSATVFSALSVSVTFLLLSLDLWMWMFKYFVFICAHPIMCGISLSVSVCVCVVCLVRKFYVTDRSKRLFSSICSLKSTTSKRCHK